MSYLFPEGKALGWGSQGLQELTGTWEGCREGRMYPCSARTCVPTQLSAWVLLDSAGRRQGIKERHKGEGEEGRQR